MSVVAKQKSIFVVMLGMIMLFGYMPQIYADLGGAKVQLDKAIEESEKAKDEAQKAKNEINNASDAAYDDEANSAANNAENAAKRAQEAANHAEKAANVAQDEADATNESEFDTAQTLANAALQAAITAQNYADEAQQSADEARTIANGKPKNPDSPCLIATATYGSELAPQVQQLREIRDNSLLKTSSGSAFMTGFNTFYYTFAPTVSDWERQNPAFKEVVKITITPLITSLSLLNYVEMNSESEVLGYGISLILLNVGMYFVLPAIVIHRVKNSITGLN